MSEKMKRLLSMTLFVLIVLSMVTGRVLAEQILSPEQENEAEGLDSGEDRELVFTDEEETAEVDVAIISDNTEEQPDEQGSEELDLRAVTQIQRVDGVVPYTLGAQIIIDVSNPDPARPEYVIETVQSYRQITLTGNYDYILTGETTDHIVVINKEVTQVTLQDVQIAPVWNSPIKVEAGANIKMILTGVSGNKLKVREALYPALYLEGDCEVAIINGNQAGQAEGRLDANITQVHNGGIGTPGGSSKAESTEFTAVLKIESGIVYAEGSGGMAAIGSGDYADMSGKIIINGGRVDTVSDYGAGIGAGGNGNMTGAITINDSIVKTDSSNGAGIGSGQNGLMTGAIAISKAAEIKTHTTGSGAGIGSGYGGGVSGEISITDTAEVEVQSLAGAGIGTGYNGTLDASIVISNKARVQANSSGSRAGAGIGTGQSGVIESNGRIIIQDEAKVDVAATGSGAGIGTGQSGVIESNGRIIIQDEAKVDVAATGSGAGIGTGQSGVIESNGGIIIQDEAKVDVTVTGSGAGIGTGFMGRMDGSIEIAGGEIKAETSSNGAGIGTGQFALLGGSIKISGGEIEAETSSNGAGIGTGSDGALNGSIEIAGGKIKAETSSNAAGIGCGAGGGSISGEIIMSHQADVFVNVSSGGTGIGGAIAAAGSIAIIDGKVEVNNNGGIAIGGSVVSGLLTIAGGTVEVNSTGIGGGIGGISSLNGRIDISGGKIGVTVTGTIGCAIGTNGMIKGGTIAISGGEVKAEVSDGPAATIGAGEDINSGSIIISGGVVEVSNNTSGAGIGSGRNGEIKGDILINNNAQVTVSRTKESLNGAGIGTGYGGTLTGSITVSDNTELQIVNALVGIGAVSDGINGSMSGSIVINSGNVNIDSIDTGIGTSSYATFNGHIMIHGGEVNIDSKGTGIGAGEARSAGVNSSITISGGQVYVTSRAAGIGGGGSSSGAMAGTITISGGRVRAEAEGGQGAGIGSGRGAGMTGTINISGTAEVTATSGNSAAGIGSGFGGDVNGVVTITGKASVTAIGGVQGGDAIGRGRSGAMTSLAVTVGTEATVRAYAAAFTANDYYGINGTSVSGDGQFVNAYFTDGITGERDIRIYLAAASGGQLLGQPDITLTLPADYTAFAYTVGSDSSQYAMMRTVESGKSVEIVNGDFKNQTAPGYGPHNVSYQYQEFETANTEIKWPVMLGTEVDEASYEVTISYHYFNDDGAEQTWSNAGYSITVMEGTLFTIDTGTNKIPAGYAAWYYLIDINTQKHYFETTGADVLVEDDIHIKVYAVSSIIDISIPAKDFFWYANEDTYNIVNDNYDIKSAEYKIENLGPVNLRVALDSYESIPDKLGEIETLLQTQPGDELVLDLTGDLDEGSLGHDLLGGNPAAFGTYTNKLGSRAVFWYSFGGYYDSVSGKLPDTSATSDYKLVLTFDLDLSGD